MYLLKKLVSPLCLPVGLCLEVLVAGLIVLWFTKRQKAGKVVVSLGAAMLFLLSNGVFATMLLLPLEGRYEALGVAGRASAPQVRWIVVLGGGHSPDTALPVTSRLSPFSLARAVEGIRLHRLLPGAKLVFSGGGSSAQDSDAGVMSELAVALGAKQEDMVLEHKSRDTKDQARMIRSIVGNDRFLLVTSGSHMPRSMGLFQKQGMRPIAAPSAVRSRRRTILSRAMLYPSAAALRAAERAFYEYLGIVWGKMRGQI